MDTDPINPTNADRANRARNVMQFYIDAHGEDETEATLADILTDMMHLCDAEEVDWGDVLVTAENHHLDEVADEVNRG